MSQPPIDYPDDEPGDGVPPGQNPPQHPQYAQYPQYPPQYPPYPQHPQYGYPPPNPKAISGGGVVCGVILFPVLNVGVGFLTLMLADQQKVLLAFGAALLAFLAFGGGFALWKTGNPASKGLGLGLMIGWALTSILTVGYCTGLNPTMYT